MQVRKQEMKQANRRMFATKEVRNKANELLQVGIQANSKQSVLNSLQMLKQQSKETERKNTNMQETKNSSTQSQKAGKKKEN